MYTKNEPRIIPEAEGVNINWRVASGDLHSSEEQRKKEGNSKPKMRRGTLEVILVSAKGIANTDVLCE